MNRKVLTGLAVLVLTSSVALAQGGPGKGPFRGGKLPPGVHVLEEGAGPRGPQAQGQAHAIGAAVRKLSQRLDRLEQAVRGIVERMRRGAPGTQAQRPGARMQGRRGMAMRRPGAPMQGQDRMRRLLQARPELRQRLARSPELRKRLAERMQRGRMGDGQHTGMRGRMGDGQHPGMRGGRGHREGQGRAMRRGPKPGGEQGHTCPNCGQGAKSDRKPAAKKSAKDQARAVQFRRAAFQRARGGATPNVRAAAAGVPAAPQRLAAENVRLKAEIHKLQAQLARLAEQVRKLHDAR